MNNRVRYRNRVAESDAQEKDEEDNNETKYDGFDKWGELDHDADSIPTGEETNRLAVCNLDWDRVNAADIFIALSSFCKSSSESGNFMASSTKIR